ncbi:MAG: transporter substrate-binding domain-containing protein [Methyloprofundus sp.]|nr:transporter substrate-binding domain-containing protein [Methyloprofundus sp.]
MKKFILLILLFTFSPLTSALSIVVKEEAPYVGSQLLNQGLSIDIINTAFNRARMNPSIIFETWPRAYEGGLIGIYDAIGSIWKNTEREKDFTFSEAYLYHEIKFIKRKSDDIQFNQLKDLNGLIVGTLKGYVYREDFTHARRILKLPQNHLIQNLIFLNQNKVDITLGDIRKIHYEIDTYMKGSKNSLEILAQPLSTKSVHIAVSKSNPKHLEIINKFNQALKAIKKDGTYAAILKKHDSLYQYHSSTMD